LLKADPPLAASRPGWLNPGRLGLGLVSVIAVLLSNPTLGMAGQSARVNSPDGLNLRDAPAMTAGVIAVLPYGTEVDVQGPQSDDGWYRVSVAAHDGFVKGAYLDFAARAPLRGDVVVTSLEGLHLRASPSTSGSDLAVLPVGRMVHITADGTTDGWYPVQAAEGAGWVNGSYLQAVPVDARAARITWYGHDFDGGVLACGGVFNADDPGVAAANGWPCGTRLKVCVATRCTTVEVRDRGHLPAGAIDLSSAAFQRLASLEAGVLAGTMQVTTDPLPAAPPPPRAPAPSPTPVR
jgi:uncharacterized protein YraI